MENTKIYNQQYVVFDEKQVVYLKEFIIYEQTDTLDKFAIFKFFNNYIEELNNVEFLIKQYDKEGNLIAENTLKYSNFIAEKKSYFSPYTKLMVEDECHRVEAVLVKATFKAHHFEDNKLSTLKDLDSIKKGFKPSRKERNKVKTKKIKNKNKIKKVILFPFLAICLAVSIILTLVTLSDFKENLTAVTDEYFHYTIVDKKEAIVDGIIKQSTDVTIQARVFDYKVTKVKQGLFQNSNVETVTIKAEEIELGDNLFRNCKSLRKVTVNSVSKVGNYAFYGCEKLNSFDFSETKKIGDSAFANTGITKVESNSITEIGSYAFENCNIQAINVINAAMGSNVFANNLNIEQISIGDFEGSIGTVFGLSTDELKEHFNIINCKPLTIKHNDFDSLDFINPRINIDFSVATIEYKSMVDYFKFANISVKDTGNAEIVDNVLISMKDQNISNITKSLLGSYSITSISPGVIAGISNTHVTIDIPGVLVDGKTLSRARCSLLEIGENVSVSNDAFKNNNNISELIVYGNPNNNYSKALKDVEKIQTITIKGSTVPAGYFEDLTQLTTVKFDREVAVGEDAFNGCESLCNVDFESIINIGNNAFEDCKQLNSINFNQNITYIGNNAFKNCSNLTNIDSLPEKVVIEDAFTGENNIIELSIFNYGVPLSNIGDFKKLEKLVIKNNYLINYLVTNTVSGFNSLKTLELPSVNDYRENIVKNCDNLMFIKLSTNYNCDSFIGTGCDSLYYVTIDGDLNIPYSSFNKSAEKTKNLYINGKVTTLFNLNGVNNLQYLKINQTNVSYFGELFGAPNYDYDDQNQYVPMSLKTVELGDQRINSNFFAGCSYIHNILLPNATNINTNAFTGMNSIRNIYFGASSLSNTGFTSSFVSDEHVYTPNILANTLVIQSLNSKLKNVNFINISGSKTYNVYYDGNHVGNFEGVLVYSIDEILDRYNLTGSLTFDKNSNTPINVNYYSSSDRIYVYEPEEVVYESKYISPVAVNYHYTDVNGKAQVETIIYDKKTSENLKYFVPECKGLFAGWYTNEELTKVFDFQKDQTIKSNIHLYAKQVDKTINIYSNNIITKINNKAYIYSTSNTSVEVFIYGNKDFDYKIADKKYDGNEKVSLDIKAHTLYEIQIESSVSYNISIVFGSSEKPTSKVTVEVAEKSFKDFKLNGSVISKYDIPKVEGYELQGWYDSRGNLIIDKYGNVYKYTSTEVYAKWTYVEN